MKVDTFFQRFDQLIDAPSTIEKIRSVVVQFAVRGKLTRKKPGDAPVGELLGMLASSGMRRTKSRLGSICTPMDVAGIALPMDIPERWAWVRLDEIGTLSGGMTPSKAKSSFWGGDVNWFSPKDIKSDELVESELKITSEGVEATGLQVYPPGCLFMVARSGILKRTFPVSINRVRATVNQDLKVLTPFLGGMDRYLQIMFRGMTDFILSSLVKTGMTVQSLKYEEFETQPFPLPPLAEQKRIVAKVDELMVLCDRLEAQLHERDTRQAALARAALARFADAPTPANLQLLFHDSFTITPADLRKTILTLAVQGRLISHTGPVRSVPLSTQACRKVSADYSAQVPATWQVARLDSVAQEIVDCPHSTPKWTNQGKICVRTSQFTPGRLDLIGSRFVSQETFRERIQRLRPRADDILYSREGGILGVACRVPHDVDLCLGQRMMLIRAGHMVAPEFLEMVLNSPLITSIAGAQTTGSAAPRVNVATVRAYPIPIPPIPEQRRIVAKVDQLMALVDQWESQLAAAAATADHLLSALVAELTAA